MNSRTDQELLSDYTELRSEAAFAELVRRHVDFVYSAALRMMRDTHLAEDVTQASFVALAENAGRLTDHPVLSGWLHRTTRNLASKTIRTEVRRRAREQDAAAMNELIGSDTEPAWNHIAPHLDAALGELIDTDRDALLLRYFERKSAREMAHVLKVSEEAAQKRVNRAVERLRELFAKRGVTVGASGLVIVISSNAIQAAPLGLIATLTSASLSGAGSSLSLLRVMTMTKLKVAIISTAVIAGVTAPLLIQHRAADTLRQTNESLREQVAHLKVANEDLSKRVVESEKAQALSQDQLKDLIRLRGEADSRRLIPSVIQGTTEVSLVQKNSENTNSSPDDVGRQLALTLIRGDTAALDKISAMSEAEHKAYNKQKGELHDSEEHEFWRKTFGPLHAAFEVLTEAAAAGNANALSAIERAVTRSELQGCAVESLGTLAGKGNDAALDALVNPKAYGLLLSSTVGALKSAADNGNQKAIDALAHVTDDPKNHPLWYMTADGLRKAAASGNPTAISTLALLSRDTNSNISDAAIAGLREAAANQHSKAVEALRTIPNK